MKKQMIDVAKGSMMGIANVIPGLSGGTIAVVLGVYDRFVFALKDLLTHPIQAIKSIWGLLVGMVIGVIVAVFLVVRLIEVAPIPTTLLFVGLIIGAIPKMMASFAIRKATWIDLIVFLVMVGLIILLPFLPHREASSQSNIVTILILSGVGIIVAMAMVIPGLSGSMLLMVIGYYFYIAELAESLIRQFATFAFGEGFSTLLILMPFVIGLVLGVVIIAKLISYLLIKYPKTVYSAIIGLLVASPFAIILTMVEDYPDLSKNLGLNLAIGCVVMLGGAYAAYRLGKVEKHDT